MSTKIEEFIDKVYKNLEGLNILVNNAELQWKLVNKINRGKLEKSNRY